MPQPGLLERSDELRQLRRALAGARAGRGSVTLVQGAAGVGKTALLAAAAAAATGIAVLAAVGGELETDLGWELVRQLFAGIVGAGEAERAELLSGAAAFAAAPLGLGPTASQAGSGSLHGLYWLAATLSRRQPTALLVDDAHWGDEPSLRFLAYLGERAADLPLALVVAARPTPRPPRELQALAAAEGCERIELTELSAGASAELTRRRIRGASPELCEACYQATRGNPFLLGELLGEVARGGTGEDPEADALAMPSSVAEFVSHRLLDLPDPARRLAEAAAIIGPADLAQAAALAELPAPEAAAAADSLAAEAILAPGEGIEFAHPLIRDAVRAAIPAHARGLGHRRAATILHDAGAPPSRVAAQLLDAAPAADAWVVERLREAAAGTIADGAPGPAVRFLRRALAEPPAAAERVQLLSELARASEAGGLADGPELLGEALELTTDPGGRALLALELGRSLYVAGRAGQAAAVLARGREEAGEENPFLATALEATWLSVARVDAASRGAAVARLRQLAETADAAASYPERALLGLAAGQLVFDAAPRERALALAEAALGEGALTAEEGSDGLVWPVLAGVLGWCDAFAACEDLCQIAGADAVARGSVTAQATVNFARGVVAYLRGDVAAALTDSGQAIAAQGQGWSQFLIAARAINALALIEVGSLDEAAAQLDAAQSAPDFGDSTMRALTLDAGGRLALAAGDPRRALDSFRAAGEPCHEVEMANPAVCAWRSGAALAAARLGERGAAAELVAEEIAAARRFGAPRPLGAALAVAGQVEGSGDLFEEAAAVLAGSGAELERARALVAHGGWLRRRGRTRSAREVLRDGLDLASRIGAPVLEARALEELRTAGARPRRRRQTDVGALTPAELRVAELAARGLGNREIAEALFVSLRTVETHLTRCYRKLGIRSRGELAERLRAPHD